MYDNHKGYDVLFLNYLQIFSCPRIIHFRKSSFPGTFFNTFNYNYSGQCLGCGKTVESIHLSSEEYEFLKEKIMRDVIDGGDQYKKTTPQVSLGQVFNFILGLLVWSRG